MLQLILGGAGSGKSAHLTELIAADVAAGRPCWLIIPEQQANLSERTILPRLPAQAGLSFRIAGFSRLSQEIAARYGGAAVTAPTPGVSALLMWENLREMQGLLQEYHTASPRSDAHLTGLLLKTVQELRATSVTPAMLEGAAGRLPEDSALRPKLYDLALLYSTYENSLLDACDGDTLDPLSRMAEQLRSHDYFSGGHIYIDSFTSFTAEEYTVISAMLRQAACVTVTLTTDEHLAKTPAQDSPEDTRRRLVRLCEDLGVPVRCRTLCGNRRTERAELIALERSLWDLSLREDARPVIPKNARGAILPLRCTNLYAEAEAVALHILDEVASGSKYGDIAVIVRDTESYRGVLDAALERYHIPFYFSEKTSLSDQPLSRLLLSALRAVARGFEVGDIMTMLKTGLCPVGAKEADLFEQYIDTWKITGAAFAAPVWTRNPDGYGGRISARGEEILATANAVRERLMTPLLRLHTALSGEHPLPELCAALYRLMEDLDLRGQLAVRATAELSAGYLKEAGETLRIYDAVIEALTDISRALPDAILDAESFATALSIVFDATELASVPSLHDSVTIGGADTLRVENIAVSFLLGLNEGEFPRAISDEGLLGEAEKQQLFDLGIELDGRAEQLSSNELLFVFRAMTKPAERLYLSTQLSSTDGKAKSPSVAYNRLFFLFPYLKDTVRTFDLSMLVDPAAPIEAEATPVEPTAPGEDDGLYTPQLPSESDLSATVLSRFYGDTLWLTQSRIQTFVQCPYRYFCTYLLAPRTREPARIDYDDSGTFMHYILEQFLRRCLDEDGQLHLPPEEDIAPLADALVNGYLRGMGEVSLRDYRTLHIFRRLRALTLLLLRDIVKELTHSRFTPCAFELKIDGRSQDGPAPYEIPLTDGRRILLGGTVDRVDFYRRGEEIFLRVIDYKSSAHDISLSDIRRGIGLQLLIYLFTLCRPEHIHPAGALYVATAEAGGKPSPDRSGLLLADPELLAAMSDTLDPTYLAGVSLKKDGSLQGSALTDAETLAALEQDIQESLRRIGEDLLGGRARRTPSADACRYCCVKDGCPDAVRE